MGTKCSILDRDMRLLVSFAAVFLLLQILLAEKGHKQNHTNKVDPAQSSHKRHDGTKTERKKLDNQVKEEKSENKHEDFRKRAKDKEKVKQAYKKQQQHLNTIKHNIESKDLVGKVVGPSEGDHDSEGKRHNATEDKGKKGNRKTRHRSGQVGSELKPESKKPPVTPAKKMVPAVFQGQDYQADNRPCEWTRWTESNCYKMNNPIGCERFRVRHCQMKPNQQWDGCCCKGEQEVFVTCELTDPNCRS